MAKEHSSLLRNEADCPETSMPNMEQARRLLYLSHLFNQFSENAWQFCIVLFLAAFSNYESLVLVSTYGMVSELLVCALAPSIGRIIDNTDRLLVARAFIGIENLAVVSATLFCYLLLSNREEEPSARELNEYSGRTQGLPSDQKSILLLIGIHVLGALARVFDSGFVVAIERDWVVMMSLSLPDFSPEKQKLWLTETNVNMKQIDLGCSIVAPAFAGLIVAFLDNGSDPHHGSDLRGAAVFVGFLNVLALIVEYFCTSAIFHQIPKMAGKADGQSSANEEILQTSRQGCAFSFTNGLRVYLEQSVSFAGIGLSLLYLNVLTFGGIMTAYLVWRDMSMEAIGIWRGVASAWGLAGTFVFNFLSKRFSLIDIGMMSVVFQFSFVSIGYASLFINDNTISLGMLMVAVCCSRIGLWVFDIAVIQLMQEHVPDHVRGVVGGVQESWNSFFFLLSFAFGLLIPDPKDFYLYAAIGYVGIGLAVIVFAVGFLSKRSSFLEETQESHNTVNDDNTIVEQVNLIEIEIL